MRSTVVILTALLLALLCLSCSKSLEPLPRVNSPDDTTPGDFTTADKSLVESSNRFGFRLFQEIAAVEPSDKNIFMSPLSVSFALGMTLNGASNLTYDSMKLAMMLSGLTQEEINQSYRRVIDLLTQLDPAVAFDIANSIWYRTGFPVTPAFLDVNQTYFDAAVRDLDFDQPWAADTINHWVDVNTNGKITDIITPPINPLTVMFLINAIYFKGNWTLPFDTGSTQMTPFQLGNGSYEDRPLMRTDTVLSYYKNDLFQAVDLPYGNKDFSMTILLPAYGHTVDEIINQLSDETWAAWMAGFDTTKVMLGVPKFKFKYEAKLNDMLSAMGMRIAFDPDYADFTNMVGDPVLGQNLHISQVKHKAFVQVDEVGTEAAAVTVVEIQLDSMPEEEIMYITRPFLFVIREHKTGTILFISKVVDPVWES